MSYYPNKQRRGAFYRTEDRLQMAVCQHLRWRGTKGLLWFAVPNGGKRMPVEAQILKATGVKAGVADLILLHAGKAFALELKTETGRATDSQIEFVDAWRAAGGEAWIAHGISEALDRLEEWGLLRRDVSRPRPSLMQLPA